MNFTDFKVHLTCLAQNTKLLGVQIDMRMRNGEIAVSYRNCPPYYEEGYKQLFDSVMVHLIDYILDKLLLVTNVQDDELDDARMAILLILQNYGNELIEKAFESLDALDQDLMAFSIKLRAQLELSKLGYKIA